jgi:ESS family glutamate:Na+ symporter
MTFYPQTFNLYSLLLDLAFASIFILTGQFLRSKVRFFQSFFIPASLIGGFLGLLLGPNGLEIMPFSNMMGSYSGLLIILVFASIGVRGFEKSKRGIKSDIERIGSYLCYRQFLSALQYLIPIALAYYVFRQFWPELHAGFGHILAAGFYGGHGTAAAVGKTYAEFGWPDAQDLAMTSATVGILVGIFGGVLMIKLGTEKGYTSYIKDYHALPNELRTGLIPAEKRQSVGDESVSPISLDPIAWHFALVLIPAGLGWILTQFARTAWGLNLPSFAVAFLVAIVFFFLLKKTGAYSYVDRRLISRVGSFATDYLVFFGVASIKIPILIKYFGPFSLLMLLGILLTVWGFWWVGPWMNRDNWFERGIFSYGTLTGVFAIGFLLLRMVDPDNKSKTLDDTAIASPITNGTEIVAVSVVPILLSTGKINVAIIGIAVYAAVCILIPIAMKWLYFALPKARPGEIE